MKVSISIEGATDMQLYRLRLRQHEVERLVAEIAGSPPKSHVITLRKGVDYREIRK